MNDKQLAQIDKWLDGQKRYKLLDCEQTGILTLKGALLQVWLASYMCEDDSQESWLSIKTMMRITGLSNRAVIDARRDLVLMGALNDTGHTANLKYINPTQGSYSVKTYSVDNPFKGEQSSLGEKSSRPTRRGREQNARAKSSLPSEQCSHKGSAVAVGVAPAVAVASTVEITATLATACDAPSPSEKPSLREDENQEQNQNQNQKPRRLSSAVKWLEKYDSPKPDGFDAWSVSSRAMWIETHRLKPGQIPPSVPPVTAPVEVRPASSSTLAPPTPPPNTPPPPARWNCPVCEYTNAKGYRVVEHIEKEHPEHENVSFKILCPEDGCNWRTWWNTIENNKAKRDAELLDHLEVEHNPNSPRYAPYKP